ncbi:hypothetical protein O1611_g1643 [Lasiodiplodia mahajangana]|uniref:Uncharacterized protein n=1 Tax=Lasiodiplodia mahajangana TaxID=1108764 RepID=A0ACC2JX14_9PEZI|nr:hypothetical protein O1611_g1643 [Lasiodiplodia mahajangana]
MDPFTALSLAGNIVQFIEFGVKLTMKGSEIYNSVNGQSQADTVILQDTTRLMEFSEKLERPLSSNQSEAEAAIASLAKECAKQARELRRILYGLQGVTLAERVRDILENATYETDTQKLEALTDKILDVDDARQISDILKGYPDATDEQKVEVIRKKLPPPTRRKKTAALIAALKSLWKSKEVEEIYNNLKEYRAQLTVAMVGVINDKNSSMTILLTSLVESNSLANEETSRRLTEIHTTLAQVRAFIEQASRPQPVIDTAKSPLPNQLNRLVNAGNEAIIAVLEGLKFDSMYTREASVSKSHSETLKWLFDPESDFFKWLTTSSGTFWVSGKPGSGKSTLMKFVSQHADTQAALRAWAQDDLLITASFYFWNAGTPMQKSLQGLLQSVLYQIMKACPILIPNIAPDRWANALNQGVKDPWTWDEAIETLDRFISQRDIKCSTCLFIDGLDEFAGVHLDMIPILAKVSDNSNMKVCLSSRRENLFNDAYGKLLNRTIRLEEHTRGDIRRYVYQSFRDQSDNSSEAIHSQMYSKLVEDIVQKADGVFLWVYLVVRSLKIGIMNEDPPSKLEQRLKELPSDLSDYFSHILKSVEERYLEDTAQIFQMIVQAQHPLPPGVLSILDEEDPDYCVTTNIQHIGLPDYKRKIQIIEKRLNARCKGLLEIRETPGSLWGSNSYHDRYLVDFLHRTVRDFLRNEDVLHNLRSRVSSSFNVDLALCRGYLLHLKQFIIRDDPTISREMSFTKTLDDLLYFAHRYEKISQESPIRILDEALRAARAATKANPKITAMMFYSTTVRYGLPRYVEYRLSMRSDTLSVSEKNLLLKEALTSGSAQIHGHRYNRIVHPSLLEQLIKELDTKKRSPSLSSTNLTQEIGAEFSAAEAFGHEPSIGDGISNNKEGQLREFVSTNAESQPASPNHDPIPKGRRKIRAWVGSRLQRFSKF